jgi:uncharacterized protein
MADHLPIEFGSTTETLGARPIRPEWILEGQPVARSRTLFTSADGTASMLVWDCTAGRFNWFYGIDESVCILEGSVRLKDSSGNSRLVTAGDTVFFPAGSQAEWTIDKYVRKVAFLRSTVPAPVVLGIRVFRRLWGVFSGTRKASAPMFG